MGSYHSIRHSHNPMLHADFMALCWIEPELLRIEISHYVTRNFPPFWLLWPWTWPDDLHIQTWPVFHGNVPDVQMCTFYIKALESYRQTDRQTDRHGRNYTTPLRGWPIMKSLVNMTCTKSMHNEQQHKLFWIGHCTCEWTWISLDQANKFSSRQKNKFLEFLTRPEYPTRRMRVNPTREHLCVMGPRKLRNCWIKPQN